MRKTIATVAVATLISGAAFAGGKNDVVMESDVSDPFVPVPAASSSAGNSAGFLVGGLALVALAIAASTGSN